MLSQHLALSPGAVAYEPLRNTEALSICFFCFFALALFIHMQMPLLMQAASDLPTWHIGGCKRYRMKSVSQLQQLQQPQRLSQLQKPKHRLEQPDKHGLHGMHTVQLHLSQSQAL